MKETKEYKIIKKIAKHGDQAIIVIPRLLEKMLLPGMIVEVNIKQLEGGSK